MRVLSVGQSLQEDTMTGTKKNMTGLGALLAAAILMIGVLTISNSKRGATVVNPVASPVLSADGSMPPPPPLPLPLPKAGTKRA
jgi:hypothetical protein